MTSDWIDIEHEKPLNGQKVKYRQLLETECTFVSQDGTSPASWVADTKREMTLRHFWKPILENESK